MVACGGDDVDPATAENATSPAITNQPASASILPGQTATFTATASGTGPLQFQWRRNGTDIPGASAATYTTPAATAADSGALYSLVVTNPVGSITSNPATLTVGAAAVAPAIALQPVATSVVAGQSANFSVMVTGSDPLQFQWRRNGAGIAGANSAGYSTPATTLADSGAVYTVVVTNGAGSVVSDAAVLTVDEAAVIPSITAQPAAVSVPTGQHAAFNVTATGTAPLRYQWRRNGTDISGANTAGYSTPATSVSDSGAVFSVVVSNGAGSVTSNPATLTVGAAAVSPAITAQPLAVSVVAGQRANFSVTATGSDPLQYQWLKNGVAISGANAAGYTTPATTAADDGSDIAVVVSNGAGTANSNAVRLTVVPAAVAPAITVQPASATVNAGQAATFTAQASGSAPLAYEWRRNGQAIVGATNASFTTAATTAADDGSVFTVRISNSAGNVTSAGATLTVTPVAVVPGIAVQPAAVTVNEGQSANFSVQATGTGPLAYQWRKNGTVIAGAAGPSYTTGAVVAADNGAVFSVTVTNLAGSITSANAGLTVTPAAPAASDELGPRSLTVTVGQTATFTTSASGSAYRWTKGGASIADANSNSYTTPPTTLSDSGSTFVVRYVQPNGIVVFRGALLTVTSTPVAPAVTAQPASVSVSAGQTATFTVAAIGTAPMTYQWQRNGVPIVGATGELYSIASVTAADAGASFSATMTNTLGTVTSNAATLSVASSGIAPTISTQPASILVNPGQTGDFSVLASGTAPLAYQWRRNGVDIPGANLSGYISPANQAADSGALYSVVVRNAAGSVTSAAGTLTVTTQALPPRIAQQPAGLTINLGQTATFALTAAGTPPFTYTWFKNNVPIVGATATTYATRIGDADENAQFFGGVNNGVGSASSQVAVVKVVLPSSPVVQMAVGQYHSALLKADGTVLNWGDNTYGVKGIGAQSSFYASRLPTGQPARVLNADNSPFTGVAGIAAGAGHSVAVKADGSVWGWGRNGSSELTETAAPCPNDNSCVNPIQALLADGTPFSGAVQVAAGDGFSVTLRSDGSVWAWGSNQYGKLGDGSITTRRRPVQVLQTSGVPLSNVVRIATGLLDTLALKADGTVWAWGRNFGGAPFAAKVATRVELSPGVPLSAVTSIAVGGSQTVGAQALAVTSDGRAYAWGEGTGGALGNGSNNSSAIPTPVVDTAGNAVTGIVAAAAGRQFSMLLKADGTVLSFGFNNAGQLGDSRVLSTESRLNPGPVRDAAGNVFGNVDLLAAGFGHAFARRNDGSVWAWGLNDQNQIIVGSSTTVRSPVQIPASAP